MVRRDAWAWQNFNHMCLVWAQPFFVNDEGDTCRCTQVIGIDRGVDGDVFAKELFDIQQMLDVQVGFLETEDAELFLAHYSVHVGPF